MPTAWHLVPLTNTLAVVQGNCSEGPPDELQALVTSDMPLGQCVLLAQAPVGDHVLAVVTHTWLDNLYIIEGTVSENIPENFPPMVFVSKTGLMWATQVTIQGSQQASGAALNQRGLLVGGSGGTEGTVYMSGALLLGVPASLCFLLL